MNSFERISRALIRGNWLLYSIFKKRKENGKTCVLLRLIGRYSNPIFMPGVFCVIIKFVFPNGKHKISISINSTKLTTVFLATITNSQKHVSGIVYVIYFKWHKQTLKMWDLSGHNIFYRHKHKIINMRGVYRGGVEMENNYSLIPVDK